MGSERKRILLRANENAEAAVGDNVPFAPGRGSEPVSLDDLLRSYWQPLVAYAAGFLKSVDAAEDVAQEAFIRVWERRAHWTADDSLRSLLYRIARNLALNEQRSQRVRTRWADRQLDDENSGPTPLQMAQAGELGEAVEHAIAALPERRREVFLLVRYHGLTYRQIADVMGISPQTVANQMSAALADLRKYLDQFLDQPAPRRTASVARENGAIGDPKVNIAAGGRGS